MERILGSSAFAGILTLYGCVVPPPVGPSFAAMPGPGKSYEQFQGDNAHCQQTAALAIGPTTPGQAATQSGVASAITGAAIGAAAGALLGAPGAAAGTGAAIGAGTGLLAGSALGIGAAQASAGGLQHSYDITYAQCMAAAGENVGNPSPAPSSYAPYPAYGYPAYGYPAYYYSLPYYYPRPYYYPPPYYYGPSVVIGGWWGSAWHGHGHYH
jgi:hypothetical protein